MLAAPTSPEKLSPLFRLAIKSGATDAIALHIERGEPVNGRDGGGLTPLMLAAMHDQLGACVKLLDAGADPKLGDPDGRTAQELAAVQGHAIVAEFLSQFVCADSDSIGILKDDVPAEEHLPLAAEQVLDTRGDSIPAAAVSSVVTVSAPGGSPTAKSRVDAKFSGLDDSDDDTNGWMPDEAVIRPSHDAECEAAASQAQQLLSTHRRVSTDADWSDIEFALPEVQLHVVALPHTEMPAVRELIATGIANGLVSASDFWHVLEADCGLQIDRAGEALQHVLDDLGILVEQGSPAFCAQVLADPDEVIEALDAFEDCLTEPADPAAYHVAGARKSELIKREDEERIGRRMDVALGALARALVALPEVAWKVLFPTNLSFEAERSGPEDEDDYVAGMSEGETDDAVPDSDDDQLDFRTYVTRLRSGMAEYGREAAVPRPRPQELSRLVEVAEGMASITPREIVGSIDAYEKARDQLVLANLRLAVHAAHGYRGRGLPLEDLIQDGNLGLMRAAEKFDFRRGFKFSTYATAWVHQSIRRGLADTVRLIRLPVHLVEKVNLIHRTRRDLSRSNEHDPSIDEIAACLSLSSDAVQRIVRSDREVYSIHVCGTDEAPSTPDCFSIVDPAADPLEVAVERSLSMTVESMLAGFEARERKVLTLRFGLGGQDSMTLEQVGQAFNVTRERIRQIEAKAIKKLRHSSRTEVLLPYVDVVPAKQQEEVEEE